jgi:hypothetical protein
MGNRQPRGSPIDGDTVRRWECRCRQPAFLLGTLDRDGRINLKVRDRYWHVVGIVRTTCPLCGREHELDSRRAREPAGIDRKGPAASS